jgi:hypothetical protein
MPAGLDRVSDTEPWPPAIPDLFLIRDSSIVVQPCAYTASKIYAGQPQMVPSATSDHSGRGGRASGAPLSPDYVSVLTLDHMCPFKPRLSNSS